MQKFIFCAILILLSCNSGSKCINTNLVHLSRDEYHILDLKFTGPLKARADAESILISGSYDHYELIGEFQIVKYFDMNKYASSDLVRLLFQSSIDPFREKEFNAAIHDIILNSGKKAVEIGDNYKADAVFFYGSKTNPLSEYKMNTMNIRLKEGCDNFIYSKYLLLKSRQ